MGYPGRQNIYEATIRRMVHQAMEEQEENFRKAHETDTDAQLLTYLRNCAVHLHHSPWPGEIVGGSYIEERFETWNNALTQAKLPIPRTLNQHKYFVRVQEETARQKEIYRKKKTEKKERAQIRLAQQAARKKNGSPDKNE